MRMECYKNGQFDSPLTFAVKHKDFRTRMASRSGGVFTALSDKALCNGGVVYGCILDEEFRAIHARAESAEMRNRMRGSKYIQSEMRDIYSAVKSDLEIGRDVLFSGTSCHVAGLKGYLRQTETNYNKLFCVDLVCHGVPSPMVWRDYLEWQEKKIDSKVVNVDFRNKKDFGWKKHIETLFFENGDKVDSKVFTTLFYGHSILRPCCYQCPYKDIVHPGNITIADYWGIDKAAPGFNDDKGVSLVLINDDKGKKFFAAVKNDLNIRETRIEDSMQPPLEAPFKEPEERNAVWFDYMKLSFEHIAQKYGGIK